MSIQLTPSAPDDQCLHARRMLRAPAPSPVVGNPVGGIVAQLVVAQPQRRHSSFTCNLSFNLLHRTQVVGRDLSDRELKWLYRT
jgi:hypothetical protein